MIENEQDTNLEETITAEKPETSSYSTNSEYDSLRQITESIAGQREKNSSIDVNLDGCVAPVNMIVNLGSIQGDIFQHHNKSMVMKRGTLQLEKEKNFGEFYKTYRNSSVFSAMIAVAALEIIPENLFTVICRLLNSSITEISGQQELTNTNEEKYESVNEILSIIKAEKQSATLRQNGGEIPIQCIVFSDPSYAEWIRRKIWSDYLQMREAVAAWIFNLKDNPEVNSILYYQIVNGISAFAKLDYLYALEKFINPVEKPWKAGNIGYVVKVFKSLLSKKDYEIQVELLMCSWMKEKSQRWRIAYQLYDPRVCDEWKKRLRNKLISEMKEDIAELHDDFVEWYRRSRRYMIAPVHINPPSVEMLIEALAVVFAEAKRYRDKENVMVYFLILFREDYLFTGYRYKKMALINSCNYKEISKQLRNLLHFGWQTKKFRDSIFQIIDFHLDDQRNDNEWEYMQRFLKLIAFTNEPVDFYNLKYLLAKSRTKHAGKISSWLDGLLAERRKTLNDKGNI